MSESTHVSLKYNIRGNITSVSNYVLLQGEQVFTKLTQIKIVMKM